jgi:hypothetical protein
VDDRRACAVGNVNLIGNADKITAFLVDSISKMRFRYAAVSDPSIPVANGSPAGGELSPHHSRVPPDDSIIFTTAFALKTVKLELEPLAVKEWS